MGFPNAPHVHIALFTFPNPMRECDVDSGNDGCKQGCELTRRTWSNICVRYLNLGLSPCSLAFRVCLQPDPTITAFHLVFPLVPAQRARRTDVTCHSNSGSFRIHGTRLQLSKVGSKFHLSRVYPWEGSANPPLPPLPPLRGWRFPCSAQEGDGAEAGGLQEEAGGEAPAAAGA